ncbi:MAG: STAS domain-containing protein [Actinobacteria bacterium]|nr:STAS domain-containing protein [Actinomycetota bacterium]
MRREVAADGVAVVAVAGEADLYNAPALQEHISAALEAGATRLVVDLTDVTFIDSTTIGVLVQGERQLRPRNGRVALVVTDANVARVFAITALDRVFAIHTTRADAVAQLAAHAAFESSPVGGPNGAENGAVRSAS